MRSEGIGDGRECEVRGIGERREGEGRGEQGMWGQRKKGREGNIRSEEIGE